MASASKSGWSGRVDKTFHLSGKGCSNEITSLVRTSNVSTGKLISWPQIGFRI